VGGHVGSIKINGRKNDVIKPIGKDIQYRLVLEAQIGGFYKF
jgi:hypothetical protein